MIAENIKNMFSKKLQKNIDDNHFQKMDATSESVCHTMKKAVIEFFCPKRIKFRIEQEEAGNHQ